MPIPARRSHAAAIPGRWLYPLATVSRLREALRPKDTRDAAWWPLTLNFPWIRPGDFVYFYTPDRDAGIVGFAKVDATNAQTPGGPRVKLAIDAAASRALMAKRPLPASAMARWLHPPKGAVENLGAATHDVDSALSSVPAYAKHLRELRRGR
jgi:hypothetical protein